MVTKKEIEEECNSAIEEAQKKLEVLKEQRKAFVSEDKQEEKRQVTENEIDEQLKKLEAEQYIGNFGSRDNWYHGRIPEEFGFKHEDSNEVKSALNELRIEKEEKIVNSKEYGELLSKREKLGYCNFFAEHRKIHDEIEDCENTIKWKKEIIRDIQDKGFLISYGKDIVRYRKMKEAKMIKDKKIKKFKEIIIKKGVQ